MSDQSRVVRLPQHILEANKRINQVRAELAAKDGYGRMIPDEEVAALLGISPAKVAFYTKVCALSVLEAFIVTGGATWSEAVRGAVPHFSISAVA